MRIMGQEGEAGCGGEGAKELSVRFGDGPALVLHTNRFGKVATANGGWDYFKCQVRMSFQLYSL